MEQSDSFSKQKHPVRITINGKWCKKCGLCIAFCPQGLFISDNFGLPPIVKYPGRCVKCMLCIVRCPDFAVDVEDIQETP